jgi:thiol-disulfide isomerase/thioredoxin
MVLAVSTQPSRRFALGFALVLVAVAMLAAAGGVWLLVSPETPPRNVVHLTDAPVPLRAPSDLALSESKPLPDLEFVDGEGHAQSLSQFRGKVVLLNLWATWCVPCRQEMPTLDHLEAKLGGSDFEVVALAIDRGGAAPVQAFYKSIGVEHLVLHVDPSGRAASALGVAGIPATLVVDREGREIGRKLGAAAWDGPEAIALLRTAIEGSAAGR